MLRTLASDGPDAFYRGSLAEAMVAKGARPPDQPGVLSAADLASYQAKLRDGSALTIARARSAASRPSSGTIAPWPDFRHAGKPGHGRPQTGTGEQGQLAASSEAIHLYSEAARLAFADRNQYVADGDVVDVPVTGLLDKGYLAQRGHLYRQPLHGRRPARQPATGAGQGRDATPELPSTSHISIVDKSGMAVAMTSSIEDGFGSRLMVNGYLLNNQLTDFSFTSVDAAGLPVANRGGARQAPPAPPCRPCWCLTRQAASSR